jgi:hypothetical protein
MTQVRILIALSFLTSIRHVIRAAPSCDFIGATTAIQRWQTCDTSGPASDLSHRSECASQLIEMLNHSGCRSTSLYAVLTSTLTAFRSVHAINVSSTLVCMRDGSTFYLNHSTSFLCPYSGEAPTAIETCLESFGHWNPIYYTVLRSTQKQFCTVDACHDILHTASCLRGGGDILPSSEACACKSDVTTCAGKRRLF